MAVESQTYSQSRICFHWDHQIEYTQKKTSGVPPSLSELGWTSEPLWTDRTAVCKLPSRPSRQETHKASLCLPSASVITRNSLQGQSCCPCKHYPPQRNAPLLDLTQFPEAPCAHSLHSLIKESTSCHNHSRKFHQQKEHFLNFNCSLLLL